MNDLQSVHYDDEGKIQQETCVKAREFKIFEPGFVSMHGRGNYKWSPGRIFSRVESSLYKVKTERRIVRRHANQIRGFERPDDDLQPTRQKIKHWKKKMKL